MVADDDIKNSMEEIERLEPQARQRVQAALKDAIDRETVAGSVGGGAAAGNIFSRGWIFSRLTPTSADLLAIKELPAFAGLNPKEFAEFAGRLAELKRKTGPSAQS